VNKTAAWMGFALLAAIAGLATLFLSPILAKNVVFVAGIPFAAMVVLVMFLNFEWMMFLILMTRALLDPVLNLTKLKGGAGMGGLLNLFVILLVASLALRFPRRLFEGNVLAKRWAVFLAIAALSVTYSPLPVGAFKLLLNLTTYMCMALLPYLLVRDEADKRYWIKVLLAASVLPVLLADVGMVTRHPALHGVERLKGTFTHPNILAFYLVFVIALVFYAFKARFLRLGAAAKVALGFYLVNIFVLLLATKTRSAWISCWAFFLIYGLLRERKYLFWGLLLPTLLYFSPPVQERMKDLSTGTGAIESQQLNSMAWRVRLWGDSVPEVAKRPVLGHGLGSFEFLSPGFFSLDRKRGAPAHNIYVELLFELGVIGLVAYLAVYWHFLAMLVGRMRSHVPVVSMEATILFAYVLSYMIVGYSDNMLYYLSFNWYFWFLVGLMARSFVLPQRDRRKDGA